MKIRRTDSFIELTPEDGMAIAAVDESEVFEYSVYLPLSGNIKDYIEIVRIREEEQ